MRFTEFSNLSLSIILIMHTKTSNQSLINDSTFCFALITFHDKFKNVKCLILVILKHFGINYEMYKNIYM